LASELEGKDIALSFAEVKGGLRESMRRTGLEDQIGGKKTFESIEGGVQAFLERGRKDEE
jgi:hypothetical protein